MIQRTLILFKCFNKDWGEMYVETDEPFPTPERALEIYKNALAQTPLGKEHPSWIKESTVEEKPMVIFNVILDEEKTLKSIM